MEPPAKKQRLQGPEGFLKPKSSYKPSEGIKKFVSAFDVSPAPVNSKPFNTLAHQTRPQLQNPSKANKETLPRANHDRLRSSFVGLEVAKEKEHAVTSSKKPVLSERPLKPVPFAPHRRPNSEGNSSKTTTLKLLKPPVLAHPNPPEKSEGNVSAKVSTSVMALQPVLKAPSSASDKPRSVLKPPPMPMSAASVNKHLGPLKPLVPPTLPPQPPTSPQKNMKTILTTSVALATDPTKEGAGAELLSLFLQQHGHGFTSRTDKELQRGIAVSPSKRWKGKDPKFVRGGFAERAQHIMSCGRTDFALWKRQIEHKIESNSSLKLSSDIRLHILRVFQVSQTPDRPRATSVPRNGLALCRLNVTSRHKLGPGDLMVGTYIVLFNFVPPQGPASVVSSTDRFEEGKEVLVWMPWQKLELAGSATGDLRAMLGELDKLNAPHSLLVVSRFCISPSKVANAD